MNNLPAQLRDLSLIVGGHSQNVCRESADQLEECHAALSRVWSALGIDTYMQAESKSVDQHVDDLVEENEKLRAVVEKLRAYDHHITQQGFDEENAMQDPQFEYDAEEEAACAKRALIEAVHLMRALS